MKELSGEYRIKAFTEKFITRFSVEQSHQLAASKTELADQVAARIKTRVGVKPKEVIVRDHGKLPWETHKSKRPVEQRSS